MRDVGRDRAYEECRESAAEVRREAAGEGGAGREDVSDSRWGGCFSDGVAGGSGMMTFGGGG